MAPSKQANRNAKKETKEEEPETSESAGSLMDAAKAVALSSCIVQVAPKLQTIAMDCKDIVLKMVEEAKAAKGEAGKDVKAEKKEEAKKEDATEDKENKENETEETKEEDGDLKDAGTAKVFSVLQKRLVWHNMLGLAASGEESKESWTTLIGLERDWGPKNKGRKVQDRIMANLQNNLSMYLHILLALMVLRAFFVRSFFACLPWLCVYQFVSLVVPLDRLEKLPQVPLEKVPIEARVLFTVFFHALVWLFFLYEAVWKSYFFEKIPFLGFFIYHAYAVRPVGS